ncbi:FAD binding domain-containing protein (plasmid) [Mycolicibacterium psychrotolerans]|uniref:FAD binding domain-containing protein n=1 Tax=Mycolicibacterium psychrotolerans TaxID=216929 RepID=UPI003D672DAF
MTTGFVEVGSLAQARDLLTADPDATRIIGGGTGLMLMAKAGLLSVPTLVSLRRVPDPALTKIEVRGDRLVIGGLCTLTDMLEHPVVARELPALVAALQRLSSVRTRNVATIAGCLVHGDPHMDLPPLLLTLDAEVVVLGVHAVRRIPCAEFFVGYYEVALAPEDIVIGLEIPLVPAGTFVTYRKFTGALAEDWAVVGVAFCLRQQAGRLTRPAVAICAVESPARRVPEVERALEGATAADIDPNEIGELIASAVEPSDDHLGSAWYKRRVLAAETARGLRGWAREAQHGRE